MHTLQASSVTGYVRKIYPQPTCKTQATLDQGGLEANTADWEAMTTSTTLPATSIEGCSCSKRHEPSTLCSA